MENKKLVILGGGESGVGAALLGKKKGMKVFLSDKGILQDHYRQQLQNAKIEFEEGKHSEDRILTADWIIKSPGIPKKSDLVQRIQEKEIPISSEIEFASRFTSSKIIAVTGSNGKTTTTLLIYHILKSAGLSVEMGGNIGNSFAEMVLAENQPDFYILEISSFQLDDIQNFKPHIALVLNLSPDHLDQYENSYEKYAISKFKIAENQDAEDYFIHNLDDLFSNEILQKVKPKAHLLSFSLNKNAPAKIEGDSIKIQILNKPIVHIPLSTIPIPGQHNLMNIQAATIVGILVGLSEQALIEGISSFRAVAHRLEKVGTYLGVDYINDSKATNVNATFYALESMTQPTIWIVGGVDKGNDYTEIADLVKKKVKCIVCLGKDNSILLNYFKDFGLPIENTHNLSEAFQAARRHSEKGDTVLLSPCCASFDLFKNYEDRGEQFRKIVCSMRSSSEPDTP